MGVFEALHIVGLTHEVKGKAPRAVTTFVEGYIERDYPATLREIEKYALQTGRVIRSDLEILRLHIKSSFQTGLTTWLTLKSALLGPRFSTLAEMFATEFIVNLERSLIVGVKPETAIQYAGMSYKYDRQFLFDIIELYNHKVQPMVEHDSPERRRYMQEVASALVKGGKEAEKIIAKVTAHRKAGSPKYIREEPLFGIDPTIDRYDDDPPPKPKAVAPKKPTTPPSKEPEKGEAEAPEPEVRHERKFTRQQIRAKLRSSFSSSRAPRHTLEGFESRLAAYQTTREELMNEGVSTEALDAVLPLGHAIDYHKYTFSYESGHNDKVRLANLMLGLLAARDVGLHIGRNNKHANYCDKISDDLLSAPLRKSRGVVTRMSKFDDYYEYMEGLGYTMSDVALGPQVRKASVNFLNDYITYVNNDSYLTPEGRISAFDAIFASFLTRGLVNQRLYIGMVRKLKK